MMKAFAGLIVGSVIALAQAASGGQATATPPSGQRGAVEAAVPAPVVAPALTAYQCPITGLYYTNPLTCKAACSGYTCTIVHQ